MPPYLTQVQNGAKRAAFWLSLSQIDALEVVAHHCFTKAFALTITIPYRSHFGNGLRDVACLPSTVCSAIVWVTLPAVPRPERLVPNRGRNRGTKKGHDQCY